MKRSVLAVALLLSHIALAADLAVGTSQELANALATASGGDRVRLAPGAYSVTARITVAPLVIEAQSPENTPHIFIGPDAPSASTIFTVDAGTGAAVELRNLVFEGESKAIGAVKAVVTGMVIEDCRFNNFEGPRNSSPIVYFSYDRFEALAHLMQPCRVSRCEFRHSAQSSAVYSMGPTVVEDCIFENIRSAISIRDFCGAAHNRPDVKYKSIIRGNKIYRTQGTPWNCAAIFTQTVAPRIHDNLIYDIAIDEGGTGMTITNDAYPDTPTRAEIFRNRLISQWEAADSVYIHEGIEYGEYSPDAGSIYENVFIGEIRPGYYNKGNDNRVFNNTMYYTTAEGTTSHWYGVGCEYKNNIQVGGWMRMNTPEQVAENVARGWDPPGSATDFPPMQYTCFWRLNETRSTYAEGPGFMRADPKFVDPANLDLHLCWDSPCINAGNGSRDGLTATDLGAFEYPIQVTHLSVNPTGKATWEWHNGFQTVAQRVIIRWHAQRFPSRFDDPTDTTVADVPATATSAQTTKTAGYFAAFVLDTTGAWSAPAPDGVHRYFLEGSVAPDTFTTWVAGNFTVAEQANAAISGPDADPDACGLTNLARYAFALPARGPVANPVTPGTTTVGTDTFFALTFPSRATADGLTYTLESSTDLVTWTAVPGQTYTAGSGPIAARDAVAIGTAPRRFLRLRVTTP